MTADPIRLVDPRADAPQALVDLVGGLEIPTRLPDDVRREARLELRSRANLAWVSLALAAAAALGLSYLPMSSSPVHESIEPEGPRASLPTIMPSLVEPSGQGREQEEARALKDDEHDEVTRRVEELDEMELSSELDEPTPGDARVPLDEALRACRPGANRCLLHQLRRVRSSPRRDALVIETFRAMGQRERVDRLVQAYVRRYPMHRRSAVYRRQIHTLAEPEQTSLPPSSPSATRAAILSVAEKVRRCSESPATARVHAIFRPTGTPQGLRVTGVSYEVRQCVLTHLRTVRVQPFSGHSDPVTIEMTVGQ